MKKADLAYKLTTDVFKHYKIDELENKYSLSGGKLFVTIYNEIFNELNLSDNDSEPVIFLGEDSIPD